MKNSSIVSSMIMGVGILGVTCSTGLAQLNTVFNDQFLTGSSDTAQSASPAAPTATGTSYEAFQQGGTPSTPSFSFGPSSGTMTLNGRTTASSIFEVEALFDTSPVSLTTVGSYLDLQVVFNNSTQIFPSTGSGTLNVGMFNSQGAGIAQGQRLDATGAGTSGGQQWLGYVGRIGQTGGASTVVFERKQQGNGTTNPNQEQDVLFNGASGSSTFNNPTGTQFGSTGTLLSGGLTSAATYTLQLRYTVTSAGVYSIQDDLYSGTGEGGTLVDGITSTSSGTLVATSFDALAFGWRFNAPSAANQVVVSQIEVQDFTPTPEPSILALTGAGLGLLGLARFRRRS